MFTEMLPRLHRAAVSLVGSPCAAGDVVHEAYLRIARRPGRFLGHPQPYAYAVTTMANLVRDQWRRDRRRLVVPDPFEGERARTDPLGGGLGELQAHWEVVRLLGCLTVKQARAVALVDLDGYSVDEAAALLGVHRSTLAVTRRRALGRLRALLEREREPGRREPGPACGRADGEAGGGADGEVDSEADGEAGGGDGEGGRGGHGGSDVTLPAPRPDAPG
ncbi:RNA polymerase sigma factor [Kitasatospora sp. RG8]|uniref:RNA polymerase sigma factor n=1 Tax=Kitasatospora sp. RG8 TaxID=2820815 RepID=UPI0027DAF41C|nr:RNA polymerase sigma factor [Kitasatospora sp. RG8]